MQYFFEAFLIGIAIATVPGPLTMIFIRKTLKLGVRGALAVGLSVACGDFLYSTIAALGMSIISDLLIDYQHIIRPLGGMFLLYLAYQDFRSDAKVKVENVSDKTTIGLCIKIFLLTISNPLTIAGFVGIFAGLSNEYTTVIDLFVMGMGVMFGSVVWWIIIGSIVLRIRHTIPQKFLERIKYVSAPLLAIFGLFAVFGK
jgi:threonine/homoserine/homoserine lactone efflux protein